MGGPCRNSMFRTDDPMILRPATVDLPRKPNLERSTTAASRRRSCSTRRPTRRRPGDLPYLRCDPSHARATRGDRLPATGAVEDRMRILIDIEEPTTSADTGLVQQALQ